MLRMSTTSEDFFTYFWIIHRVKRRWYIAVVVDWLNFNSIDEIFLYDMVFWVRASFFYQKMPSQSSPLVDSAEPSQFPPLSCESKFHVELNSNLLSNRIIPAIRRSCLWQIGWKIENPKITRKQTSQLSDSIESPCRSSASSCSL